MKKITFLLGLILFTAYSSNAQTKFNVSTNADPISGGTIIGGGEYDSASTATLTANISTGYTFQSWSGDTTTTDNPIDLFVNSDKSVTANFLINSYTISTSVDPESGGSISGLNPGGTYDHGDEVNITATPSTGYSFTNWTEGVVVVSTDANYSFPAEANRTLVANFTLNTHTLSTTVDPIASGTVTGAGTYDYGETANVEATPATGYTFSNWSGDLSGNQNPETILIDSDKSVQANFIINSYTITTSSDPAIGGTTTGSGSYDHGATVNLVATPASGYTFVNWTEGVAVVSADSEYTFTAEGNRTLTANFELKTYTITTSVSPIDGGSVTGLNPGGVYTHGTMVDLTAVPAEGYVFVNWTEDGTTVSSDANYSFTANKNRSLVANFTLNNYVITTTSNPVIGGSTTGAGGYNHGDEVTVIANPATGYTFDNWTENSLEVSTDSLYVFNATASRDLVANFSKKQYKVTTTPDPVEGGTTTGDGDYIHGTLVNIVATPKVGWNFDNWKEGNSILSSDSSYTFVILGERNITGNFSKKIYAINTSSNPTNGGITSGGGNYEHGAEITLTATPNAGWNFVNWKIGDVVVSTDSVYSFLANTNLNLVANFTKKNYAIMTSVSPSNAGITRGDSVYTHGDQVTVSAVAYPDSGYNFLNWTEEGTVVATTPVYKFTASRNRNLVANFILKTYTVALGVNPSEAGSVQGSGTYSHGDSVTIIATPSAGWLFANWTENDINLSSNPTYKFRITGNRNITANFAKDLYSINASVDPVESGFVSGAGSFFFGQTATLIATPNAGWDFKNWTENGTVQSTNPSYEFTVSGNRTLVANFSLTNYSINCTSAPLQGGTTTGSGLFFYQQQITVTATPNTGWVFVSWSEGEDTVSYSASYTFSVEADRNLVANYETDTGIESLDGNKRIPDEYYMLNPYPNPFNPSTNIEFGIPESSEVSVIIFDINGQVVSELLKNVSLPAGNYKNNFVADNLSSGIYFYRIQAQSSLSEKSFINIGKLILVK